jgi:hypothetical protein
VAQTLPSVTDILDFVKVLLGFISGAIMVMGSLKLAKTDMARRFRVSRLDRKLNGARKAGDRERIKELELMMQVQKLYFSDAVNQGTAIEQIKHWGDERAFEILVARLGNAPELCPESKPLLLAAVKSLLRSGKF